MTAFSTPPDARQGAGGAPESASEAAPASPAGLAGALRSLQRFAAVTLLTTLAKFVLRIGKNVLLTRVLGPEARGVYGLLNSIPGLFVSFGNLGFGLGSLYLCTTRQAPLRKLLGNALAYAITQGLVLAGFAFALHTVGEGLMAANRAAISAIGFFILFGIPMTLAERLSSDMLLAVKDIHFLNLTHLANSVAPVVVLLGLWPILGDPLQAACWGWLLSMVLVSAMTLARLWRMAGGMGLDLSLAKDAISYGLRGNVSQFAGAVTRRIDMLLLALFLPPEDIGQYAAAVSIGEMLLFLPEAVSMPFMPLRMEMAGDKDQTTALAFSATILKYTVALLTPLLLVFALVAHPVVFVLYGEAFLPAVLPLVLLLPGILALALYQVIKADLYSLDRPGLLSWINVGVMLSNVALNLVFIPWMGVAGAALASSICYSLSAVACLVSFVRITGAHPRALLLLNRGDLAIIRTQLTTTIQKKLGKKKDAA